MSRLESIMPLQKLLENLLISALILLSLLSAIDLVLRSDFQSFYLKHKILNVSLLQCVHKGVGMLSPIFGPNLRFFDTIISYCENAV